MNTTGIREFRLGETIIRVCPACGVVNPQGPSNGCPHLQLVRFNGVPASLETVLMDVATLRRAYVEKLSSLKQRVRDAVQTGEGHIEVPRQIRAQDVDTLYSKANDAVFALSNPGMSSATPKADAPRARKSAPRSKPLDDRQLDLLLLAHPKGEA
ncbi:MAG: hypothetical protein M0R76_02345 [Proteobacteria bacterium]|jgi:hypothetical protein|nr:hypothetical protein [Pseudomonadota bacterium]NLN62876.1 hypothetical protein [Myxococcales bacterium]